MPKRILIAYANEAMKYSLKQLGIQLHYIKQIDKVILYTEKDLPTEVKNHPLMQYKRGGGYWVWKPYLIWKTLQDFPEGTKVCYLDAGCSVYPGKEWDYYWNLLDASDTILFQYAAQIPRWKDYFQCQNAATIYWTKKETVDFMDQYLQTPDYHDFPQIWAGLIFCKGQNNFFIKEWLDLTHTHPGLIKDPTKEELNHQHFEFNGNHRHDQSVVTPLAFKWRRSNLLILPEKFDENRQSKIIITSRNRVTKQMYNKIFLKYHLQGILGLKTYNKLKSLLQ